ncbi:MAG: hypothetical protein OXC63_09070 [Aestuariivita sp.]|nr:hypothetical protein [Aestuariivita sp.]MCY4346670.1 hypothetical protein [Aestuariivita sp.]
MTNDIDDELNDLVIPDRAKPDTAKRVNFKQAVEAVCRKVESLFMPGTNHLSVVTDMLRPLAAGAKRGRLGRSRERRSHKPINKFQKRK